MRVRTSVIALVGSDDKATVTFEVTAPTFKRRQYVNYICMVDGTKAASSKHRC